MKFHPNFIRKPAILQTMETKSASEKKAAIQKWLKRVGIWGFLFFLIKGLVWLAIFYWGSKML